jgi:hypothetical protein
MLTGIMYVLVPMPYLFFGSAGDGQISGSLASGWATRRGGPIALRGVVPVSFMPRQQRITPLRAPAVSLTQARQPASWG